MKVNASTTPGPDLINNSAKTAKAPIIIPLRLYAVLMYLFKILFIASRFIPAITRSCSANCLATSFANYPVAAVQILEKNEHVKSMKNV